MAKQLVYNYEFDASAQTVTIRGRYLLRALILITNVTDGVIIYNFADSNSGATSVTYDPDEDETTITLEYNTTSMSDTDELQILLDEQETTIEPGESIIDPVHKMRVSNPENLIDTDFEYGLQPTKWETIELVSNIPSVYTRGSGVSIENILTVNTLNGTQTVTVTTGINHDLSLGDPIEVQGLTSRTAQGKYIVTTVISDTKFSYRASAVQSATEDISTAYTTIIPGSFFNGSEINYDINDGIQTDNGTPSNLTFTADHASLIRNGTSLYVTNTVGKEKYTVANLAATAPDSATYVNPSNDSIYIGANNLSEDQKITITPTSGSLPSLNIGAPEPNASTTLQSVYNSVVAAMDTNVAAMTYHENILQNYNGVNGYYCSGNFNRFTGKNGTVDQYLGFTDYSGGYTYNYLYNSGGSYRATYRIAHNVFTRDKFNGQPFDVGKDYIKTNDNTGQLPSTLSGYITMIATPQSYLVQSPYIITIREYKDITDLGGGVVSRVRDVWYPQYKRATNTTYRNYDYYYEQQTEYNAGDNWYWTYAATHINGKIFTNWPGFTALTITLGNSNWNNYRSGTKDHRSYTNNSYISLGHYSNDSVSGTFYTIEVLTAFKPPNYSSNSLYGISGTELNIYQMANNIVQQIRNDNTFAQWANGTNAANEVYVEPVDENRISLKSADGAQYSFSNTGSGSAEVETEQIAGVLDGYFDVDSTVTSAGITTFTLGSSSNIAPRVYAFTNSNVIIDGGLYYIDISDGHGLLDGQTVTFNVQSGTAPAGLSNGTVYYAIVYDDRYLQLASSESDWVGRVSAISGAGSGSFNLTVDSISGRAAAVGTVSITENSNVVTGNNTKFLSNYKIGDNFSVVGINTSANISQYVSNTVQSIVSDSSMTLESVAGVTSTAAKHYLDTKVNVRADGTFIHRPFDGGVEITAGKSPDSQIIRQTRKYFRYQSGKGIQCSMAVNFNPSRPVRLASGSGSSVTMTTEYPHGLVAGNSILVTGAEELASYTPSNAAYNANTGYLTITITNHGFQKGEYITLAEESITFTCDKDGNASNHSYPRATDPAGGNARLRIISVTTNTFVVDVGTSTYAGNHTFVSAATNAVTHIDTSNAYNGTHEIVSATDFTFTYTSSGTVSSATPGGYIEYSISRYNSAGIRAGLFDFQNGFFFEYDGKDLSCVRRSSVQQVPGTVLVNNKSNRLFGTNTRWNTHLSRGDMIVVRGQSYRVSSIESDTEIHIEPAYRGTSDNGVIITRTVDVKVPQHKWNLDKGDGTGPSGYSIDINKIQMVYLDYSWYGAGKIRFGFKDTHGHVRYMHEFIHNNRLNEAYMRSGNIPARYEAFNSATPSFVPSLFHWGTSVIMDGGFDDDDSYLFTAPGNTLTFTNGDADTAVTTGNSSLYSERTGFGRLRNYYVRIPFATSDSSKFSTGIPLYTSSGDLNGETVDFTSYGSGSFDVYIFISQGYSAPGAYPIINAGTTVNIGAPTAGAGGIDLNSDIPLISIRLAPSVDNNLIGSLGARDIINRMQLKLKELGVSTSHDTEIKVILNGSLSNLTYENVGTPSLSQYVAHVQGDTVNGGTTIYQFRASGGATDTTGKRLVASNAFDLSQLIDLGNSILGGDDVFPNGPDIITIAASVINTAEVDSANSFQVASRISWSESQA